MAINIRVIATDRTVWDAQGEEVILPSISGQIGILNNHAPLLTALDIGIMRVRANNEWVNIVVSGGFAEIENNDLTVLVNEAEKASFIDVNEAQKELEAETLNFNQTVTSKEKVDATQRLRRAKARVQAALDK